MHCVEANLQRGRKWKNKVCESVVKKLNTAKEYGVKYGILVGGMFEFQVTNESVHYIMNLQNRTCDFKE